MRKIVGLTVLLGLVGGPFVAADDKPAAAKAPPAVSPVEKLIEQLGSPDYRVRESASKALEAKGGEALPALRKAAATADAEVRKRLAVLVQSIERAAILAPKRVTLKLANRPLPDAVAELAKQTGYQIQFQGGGQKQLVSLDLENVEFWPALEKICLEGGLVLQSNDGTVMQLYQQDSYTPFVCHRGPFRLIANSFNYNKSLQLGSLPRNGRGVGRSEHLSFQFNIQAEPKLPLMGVGQAKLTEAVDAEGNSMVPAQANGYHESYYGHHGYRTFTYSAQVGLAWPSKDARTVKVLKGTVPVTLLAETKPEVTVENVVKVKNQKFAGPNAELQIEVVTQQGNNCQIKMTVRNLAKNAGQDYSWTSSVYQRLELFDAKGNKFGSHGCNWENSTTTSMTGTFVFGPNGNAPAGPPAKLVYNTWVTMPHEVEFEFRNLPLP